MTGLDCAGKALLFSRCRKLQRHTSFTSSRTRTSALSTLPPHTHHTIPHRNLCAIHARRVTIMQRDIQLARRIRGPWGGLG